MKLFTVDEIIKPNITYNYAIFSDLHIGSKEFDAEALIRDLKKCVDTNTKILLNGDTMDMILLQDIKRAAASRIKHEDGQVNKYIDEATEILMPFISHILMIAQGNHETAITKHHGVNVLSWLIERLNKEKKNGQIQQGHYSNFVRINFLDPRRNYKKGGKYDIFMTHGAGGSAPVSKGMIDFNRIAVANNADLYAMGHKHNHLETTYPEAYITDDDRIAVRNRKAIQTPSYTQQVNSGKENAWIDSFYGKQAAPSFARVELLPTKMSTGSMIYPYTINSRVWIDSNNSAPQVIFDEIQAEKLATMYIEAQKQQQAKTRQKQK